MCGWHGPTTGVGGWFRDWGRQKVVHQARGSFKGHHPKGPLNASRTVFGYFLLIAADGLKIKEVENNVFKHVE